MRMSFITPQKRSMLVVTSTIYYQVIAGINWPSLQNTKSLKKSFQVFRRNTHHNPNGPSRMPATRMRRTQDEALKIAAAAGILALAIWGGVVSLTSILDRYGFGPNTQTQQERIQSNLNRLEETRRNNISE